jgi:hypothetical protein
VSTGHKEEVTEERGRTRTLERESIRSFGAIPLKNSAPRKVIGEASPTPSSKMFQGRSFQIANLPDVVIKAVRVQAAKRYSHF